MPIFLPSVHEPTMHPSATAAHRQPERTSFLYECWRRALIRHDEHAWQIVYNDYQRLVRCWVKAYLRLPVDDVTRQTLVDDAFLKMAGTFARRPEKFVDYTNLAALLGLLRRCTQRVVQDYISDQQRCMPTVALEEQHEPAFTMPIPADFWPVLDHLLHDQKERLVVDELLLAETKPRRLYQEYADLFQDVDEIHTIRERIILRLRRNRCFLAYLCALVTQ